MRGRDRRPTADDLSTLSNLLVEATTLVAQSDDDYFEDIESQTMLSFKHMHAVILP